MTTRITEADDARLNDYLNLTDVALRSRTEPAMGLFIAESAAVIRRALTTGYRLRSVLMDDRWRAELGDLIAAADSQGAEVFLAGREVLESVTGFHVHRGALAAMHRPPLRSIAEVVEGARRIVILEDIVDHTNVGAIFRSVAALGADAVLVTPRCADPLYRRSVRVSMGAVFHVPWTRIDPWPGGLSQLRQAGLVIAALALRDDAVSLDALASAPPERLALVLGAEGDGLAPSTLDAADMCVRIPMLAGIDSLNVAAASAVALWALRTTGR